MPSIEELIAAANPHTTQPGPSEIDAALARVLARRAEPASAAAGYQHPQLARQRILQHNYRPGSGSRRIATGLTAAAAAGAVVLGLGLSGALSSAPGPGSAAARGTGTIRTAAFTLARNANGTDTLTINPGELLDPRTLQDDLAKDGIPAKVTIGSFCSTDPAPAGLPQVVTVSRASATNETVTINPAAMPTGTELSYGNFQLAKGQEAAVTLIDTNSYTCTSTPPTTWSPDVMGIYQGRTAGSK